MRVKTSKARRKRNRRLFREAKGNVGGRRRLIRTVKETLVRSHVYSFRDRRAKKRDFRRLWITRLTAAARLHGLRYSSFIHGLGLANIELNRKTLSELAIHQPQVFAEIMTVVQSALASHAKA